MFDGPDTGTVFPLNLVLIDVGGPPFAMGNSAEDGTYRFEGLPAGNYHLFITVGSGACAASIRPFTWVGDTFGETFCGTVHLTTSLIVFALDSGEDATGVDFPQIPSSYDVTARIWRDAQPLPKASRVTITVDGTECWPAKVDESTTAGGATVSFYKATLTPSPDPRCHAGDLDLTADGMPALAPTDWNRFWRYSLSFVQPVPLNLSADVPPFFKSTDLTDEPFLGLSGQVVEPGSVTPENVSRREGTLVRDSREVTALVGSTICGTARTKALTTASGEFGGNLFGLVVPPASVQPGCGTPGSLVSFCIDDFKARQPAAGPFVSVVSPEASPVLWDAPSQQEVTLEPTSELCPVALAPRALPDTGGRPLPATAPDALRSN
jgi:hypothetical protein